MNVYLLTEDRKRILNAINRWKILDTASIAEEISYRGHVQNLRKQLRKMENYELLASKKIPGIQKKYYYVPYNQQKFLDSSSGPLKIENFNHDLLLSQILRELRKYERVIDAKIEEEHEAIGLHPDGEINYKSIKGNKKRVAIELELTRKQKSRYRKKFDDYNNSSEYDLIIYIFIDSGIYNSYKDELIELNKRHLKNYICLLNLKNFNAQEISFEGSDFYFFDGQMMDIKKFFGNQVYS